MVDEVRLVISLPADVVAALGETDKAAASAARRAVLLHLLRVGVLSQGRAATLLGVTRHEILDLMTKYDILSGPQTLEEYRRDVERATQALSNRTL